MSNIQEQKQKVEAEIKKLESMGGSLTGHAKRFRDSAFARFPVAFVILSSFGLVATFYGFEKVIDDITYFSENPKMILVAGLVALAFTGTLYKKLN
ncbi:MAG: hypothetical protein ACI9BF_000528 [Candidatus Paceibacteria bacterium]|jgi:hypothetical protein